MAAGEALYPEPETVAAVLLYGLASVLGAGGLVATDATRKEAAERAVIGGKSDLIETNYADQDFRDDGQHKCCLTLLVLKLGDQCFHGVPHSPGVGQFGELWLPDPDQVVGTGW